MTTALWAIGKSREPWVNEALAEYRKRLPRLTSFEYREIEAPRAARKAAGARVAELEAAPVEKLLGPADRLYLFDERGRAYDSRGFADFLEGLQHGGGSRLVFLIGGAYGFGESLRRRAAGTVRLSDMTLTHQFARVVAIEQIYRAHTILRGLPYHND